MESLMLAKRPFCYGSPEEGKGGSSASILDAINARLKDPYKIEDQTSLMERIKDTTFYVFHRSPSPDTKKEWLETVEFMRSLGGDVRVIFYDDKLSEEEIKTVSQHAGRRHSEFLFNVELHSEVMAVFSRLNNFSVAEIAAHLQEHSEKDDLQILQEIMQKRVEDLKQNDEWDKLNALQQLIAEHYTKMQYTPSKLGGSFSAESVKIVSDNKNRILDYSKVLARHILPLIEDQESEINIKIVLPTLFDHEVEGLLEDREASSQLERSLRTKQDELDSCMDNPDKAKEIEADVLRLKDEIKNERLKVVDEIILNLKELLPDIPVSISILETFESLDQSIAEEGDQANKKTLYIADRHVIKYTTGGLFDVTTGSASAFLKKSSALGHLPQGRSVSDLEFVAIDEQVVLERKPWLKELPYTLRFLCASSQDAQIMAERISKSAGMLVLPLLGAEGHMEYSEQLGCFKERRGKLPNAPTPFSDLLLPSHNFFQGKLELISLIRF